MNTRGRTKTDKANANKKERRAAILVPGKRIHTK
jgi:hypothetical protein